MGRSSLKPCSTRSQLLMTPLACATAAGREVEVLLDICMRAFLVVGRSRHKTTLQLSQIRKYAPKSPPPARPDAIEWQPQRAGETPAGRVHWGLPHKPPDAARRPAGHPPRDFFQLQAQKFAFCGPFPLRARTFSQRRLFARLKPAGQGPARFPSFRRTRARPLLAAQKGPQNVNLSPSGPKEVARGVRVARPTPGGRHGTRGPHARTPPNMRSPRRSPDPRGLPLLGGLQHPCARTRAPAPSRGRLPYSTPSSIALHSTVATRSRATSLFGASVPSVLPPTRPLSTHQAMPVRA